MPIKGKTAYISDAPERIPVIGRWSMAIHGPDRPFRASVPEGSRAPILRPHDSDHIDLGPWVSGCRQIRALPTKVPAGRWIKVGSSRISQRFNNCRTIGHDRAFPKRFAAIPCPDG